MRWRRSVPNRVALSALSAVPQRRPHRQRRLPRHRRHRLHGRPQLAAAARKFGASRGERARAAGRRRARRPAALGLRLLRHRERPRRRHARHHGHRARGRALPNRHRRRRGDRGAVGVGQHLRCGPSRAAAGRAPDLAQLDEPGPAHAQSRDHDGGSAGTVLANRAVGRFPGAGHRQLPGGGASQEDGRRLPERSVRQQAGPGHHRRLHQRGRRAGARLDHVRRHRSDAVGGRHASGQRLRSGGVHLVVRRSRDALLDQPFARRGPNPPPVFHRRCRQRTAGVERDRGAAPGRSVRAPSRHPATGAARLAIRGVLGRIPEHVRHLARRRRLRPALLRRHLAGRLRARHGHARAPAHHRKKSGQRLVAHEPHRHPGRRRPHRPGRR